jgi:hypothetical protein
MFFLFKYYFKLFFRREKPLKIVDFFSVVVCTLKRLLKVSLAALSALFMSLILILMKTANK